MPPKGDQCPFCQLISNPSQLKVVGENKNFYAWLDINPRAKGYTMVVPKEHKESVEDFSAQEYQEAMKLVRKVVDKAKKGLGADGVSVTMNIDETAGQMVPHAYIQIFPRFEDEETAGTPTGAIFQPHEEAKKNLDEIKEKMASVESDFGETTKEAHPDSKKFKSGSGSSSVSGSEPLSGGITGMGATASVDTGGEEKSSEKGGKDQESEEESDIKEDIEAKSYEWQ